MIHWSRVGKMLQIDGMKSIKVGESVSCYSLSPKGLRNSRTKANQDVVQETLGLIAQSTDQGVRGGKEEGTKI